MPKRGSEHQSVVLWVPGMDNLKKTKKNRKTFEEKSNSTSTTFQTKEEMDQITQKKDEDDD